MPFALRNQPSRSYQKGKSNLNPAHPNQDLVELYSVSNAKGNGCIGIHIRQGLSLHLYKRETRQKREGIYSKYKHTMALLERRTGTHG